MSMKMMGKILKVVPETIISRNFQLQTISTQVEHVRITNKQRTDK
jgi:hypothetical protein